MKKNFCVDDALPSENGEQSAIRLAHDMVELLVPGRFNLTKFMSNSKRLLSAVPNDRRSKPDLNLDWNEQFCDVVLEVGSRDDLVHLKAHRITLCAASPFFYNALNSNIKEKNEGVIRLGNTSKAAIEELLQYLPVQIGPASSAEWPGSCVLYNLSRTNRTPKLDVSVSLLTILMRQLQQL